MRIYFLIYTLSITLFALPFNLIKKDTPNSKITMLVIGGIHGNEPGGYNAANLLSKDYKILHGNVWIVPNLNAKSIQANRRGVYGDMNRKFAKLSTKDHDYSIIEDIKHLILNKKVDLILNLHDGHGFYRSKYTSIIYNQKAWGQTCVIDQNILKNVTKFGNLKNIAIKIKKKVNNSLVNNNHIFNIKNTRTKAHDKQMQLSLTYFAILHHKPAFAIETSKSLSNLAQKVYYQLTAIEEFMHLMGIKYKRDFKLTIKGVQKQLQKNGNIIINNNILLNLTKIKKSLSYIPLESSKNKFSFSSNIGSVKKSYKRYAIYIGNCKVTTLHFIHMQMCEATDKKVSIFINGKERQINFASEILIKSDFIVKPNKKFRVNIIGFTKKGYKNEAGLLVSLKLLRKKYSIDKKHKVYRIEFYKNNLFCGMILAKFIQEATCKTIK